MLGVTDAQIAFEAKGAEAPAREFDRPRGEIDAGQQRTGLRKRLVVGAQSRPNFKHALAAASSARELVDEWFEVSRVCACR